MAVTDFADKAPEQPEPEERVLSVRERLLPPMPADGLWAWLGPALIALFGGFLRFDRLEVPKAVVFDETYYAKDAWSTLKYGVETQFLDGDAANQAMLRGDDNIFKVCQNVVDCGSYVVHPPLGKWMIALGEWMFGLNPFGWRFAAALVGTISIFLLARLARRMTRSTVLGCLAGFLLAVDGLHFVLSRTALLDIFLMFWLLAGFACLVVDRDKSRERLADWYENSPIGDLGPKLGLRPWRLAAGLCLGAALATKWTGILFIAAFGIMTVLWDLGARRAVGLRRPVLATLKLDVPLAFAWVAILSLVVYVVSFVGWFAGERGYGRNWAEATSGGWQNFVFSSMRSWLDYQTQILSFHTGLETTHPYQSQPWQWPLLTRPVAFFYESPSGCGADSCSWAVLGTGTPIIWYAGLAALIAMIAWYVATRDWRAGAILLGYAAGWLPWFYFAWADNRTMFLFYAIPMVPFMILAIVLAAGLLIGPATAPLQRRRAGAIAVGVFALLSLLNFWWLYPVLSAELLPYQDWYDRMLYKKGWI